MSDAPPAPPPASLAPPPADGFRTFLVLWLTQSASMVGSQVTFFAVNVWLAQGLFPAPEQKALLASALGANGLAYALPLVLGQPLAGVWADRHERRTLMLVANVAAAIETLVLAGLMASGHLTLPVLLALMAVYGFTGAVHQAAFDTAYIQLVRTDQLQRANAMMGSTYALAGVLSPGLAALLIAFPARAFPALAASVGGGTGLAILVDVVTFALAALVLLRLPLPPSPRAAGRSHVAAELAEGLRFVFGRRELVLFVVLLAAANFTFAFVSVLMPLLAKFDLAADAARHGLGFEATLALVNSIGGLGGVLGGVAMGVWGGVKRRRATVVLAGLGLMGAFQIGLGLSSTVWMATLFVALTEGAVPFVVSHSLAIWQILTPAEMQGRVLAARRMVALGTFPLGNAIAGGLAAAWSARNVFVFSGVVLALTSVALAADRGLRHAGDPAPD